MAQAVVWQLLYIIVGGLIGCFSSGIMLAGITGSLLSGSRDGSTLAIYCYRAITLLTAGAFVLPGLAAAWASWNGRRFRYPLIAGWVERRMTPR
jgi:hypothetical protein